jgi:1,4-alpha-glucan branching enzyme
LEKHQPCYASSAGAGYGENLLSSKNSWMMRYIRKASERMVDLADRFPNDTGLKTRLLNLGVKQLLVAQSLNIAKSIDDDDFPTFAKERFTSCIEGFTTVFDSLGSNVVSTEWLTTLENKDNFYPWMNYRIFSKKK